MRTTHIARTAAVLGALASTVAVGVASAAPFAPPVNVDPPTVTGTPRVGEALTAQNGTWLNNPTEFRYRWLRCNEAGASCVLLAADGRTYRVGQADVGDTMRVRVTAFNSGGATNARSAPTGVVSSGPPLENTARPTISGEARVGQELTANDGTWSGNPTSFAFQWQRCDIDTFTCAAVPGATGRTYDVRAIDVGFRLRVQITARSGDRSGTAVSAATPVVRPAQTITNRRPTLSIIGVRFLGAARLRALPDLRRPGAEPRRPRPRAETPCARGQPAVRDAGCAAAVRRVHAQLGPGAPLPRRRPVHDRAAGPRRVGPAERAGAADVPPLTFGQARRRGRASAPRTRWGATRGCLRESERGRDGGRRDSARRRCRSASSGAPRDGAAALTPLNGGWVGAARLPEREASTCGAGRHRDAPSPRPRAVAQSLAWTESDRNQPGKEVSALLALTDNAVEAVEQIVATSDVDSEIGGLRMVAERAGTQAYFRLSVVPVPAEDDEVIEEDGARVFLDPEAASLLDDKVLDVSVEQNQLSFTIGDQ